jgi:type IV secretory pathway TraG/TraD family ATPase VirD4
MAWRSVMQGPGAVLLAYLLVALPMLVGLRRGRAPLARYLGWPFAAALVTLVVAILWALIGETWHAVLHWQPPRPLWELSGALCFAASGYAAGWVLARSAPLVAFKRGAIIEHDVAAASAAPGEQPPRRGAGLTLAGMALAPQDETKHFKLIGTTGTGKSTAIRELLRGALARGDRAVIADPDAGYMARFYQPSRGDVLLNPFDARSRRWDLFAEIREPYDIEQLARSLIAERAGQERIWREYARTFFTAVTRQLHEAGVHDTAELYRLLSAAPGEELQTLVAGSPAQPFLEPANAKMFASLRAVAVSALGALDYLQRQPPQPRFSIREWVGAAPAGRGALLFLPYRAAQIEALRSLIATWMRIAIFEAMNRAEGDQRLWFVVDELDALGPIDGLKDALARLRKFGGRCVLGLQSISQVRATYGESEARTIVENCGNTLILRCSASEGGGTARFASELLGDREVVRTQVARSLRPGELRATRTVSQQHVTERAVMASEIEQLADLSGYLKIASQPAWRRVAIAADA